LLATYVYSFASSTLILSIGALLSSYIRPEFFLTYLLLSALFCIVIFSDKEQILGHFHLLILFFLCSLAFMIYIGIPAFSKNSVRSYIAFSDHFALNWASWTKSDLNPWWVVISDGAEITDQTFGHARSIFAAAIYNPSMFGKHIVSNLQNIGKTLYWLLDPQYYRMFQSYNYGFSHKILEISFLFIIVGQYLYTIRERWMSKIMIKEKIENYKKFFIYFLICSIPGLISAIVFFPRNHYLVLPSVLLVIGIAIVFTAERRIQISTSYRELLIMGCFMIMLTPTPEIIHRSFVYEAFGRNENLKTINLLKSLKISADVNLLNAEGEYAVYVSDNYHIIDYWIKNTTFEDFMKEKQINMIALSEKLEKSSKFHDDEQWKYFLVHYENFGYTKINIEGTSRELLVNKDLLK
jgi:hypothetical protein